MRYAAKILWQETWTACWSCFPKTTTSSPERGAFLQSQFLPLSFDLFLLSFFLTIPPVIPRHSHSDFQAYTRVRKNKSYICKPDTGCQGKGIFITKSCKDIPQEHMICQLYISRVSRYSTSQSVLKTPHLINSFVISSAAFHYWRIQVRFADLRAGDIMWPTQSFHVQGGPGPLLHHEVQRTSTQQCGQKH